MLSWIGPQNGQGMEVSAIHPLPMIFVTLSPPDRTWQGVIGVRLDASHPWSSVLHTEMVKCLCSCFEGANETQEVL